MSGPVELDRPVPRPELEAVRALRRFEPGRPAFGRGLRAGIAMGAALAVGVAVGNETAGILAALGALNVVMADSVDVPLRRRVVGLAVAVVLNAAALTLGSLVGVHLWSALVVMVPVTLLAGMAGTAGEQGATIGLTTGVVYMVGLGLAGSGPGAALTYLDVVIGGLFAIVVLVVRLPPDPLGPARRSVAGALEAASDVYRVLADPGGDGPRPERAVGLERVARHRLAAARQILRSSTRERGADAGEVGRLGSLVDLVAGLLVRSEALVVLHRLLLDDGNGAAAGRAAGLAAAAVSDALAHVAQALTRPGPIPGGAPVAGNAAGAIRALEDEVAAVSRLARQGGAPEAVRRAVTTLTVLRPLEEEWRAVGELLGAEPSVTPAATTTAAPAELRDRLRRNLSPRSATARRSAQFAVTAMAGYVLAHQLGLDKAYWVTLTIAVILQPAAAPSLERAFLRFAGTVVGSVVGVALLAAVRDRNGLIVLIVVLAVATFSLMRINYALGVVFLTPLVLTVVSLPHPGDWHLALTRVEATGLGAALVVVSGLALWPGAARVRITRALADAFSAESRYLAAAWAGMATPPPADERINSSRRAAALLADNAEADLDRWLGDVPRHREELGLLWSLTDTVRSVHLDVTAIAEHARGRPPAPVPAPWSETARWLEGALGAVAVRLDTLSAGAAPAGHEPAASGREAPLEHLHEEVERLADSRAAELLGGGPDASAAGRAARDLRLVELAFGQIAASLARASADVGVLEGLAPRFSLTGTGVGAVRGRPAGRLVRTAGRPRQPSRRELMDDQTRPNDATADADREEASRQHQADRAPSSEEEAAAERARQDPETGNMEEVGEHYREMADRGVDQQGEGRIG